MSTNSSKPIVATVLVNWKGAEDTIQCILSLLGSDYAEQIVIVVENGSPDGSLKRLETWAAGANPLDDVAGLLSPPGVTYGNPADLTFASIAMEDMDSIEPIDRKPSLYLVDAGSNRGFAGGMNVGCRLALQRLNAAYVWILNNDTVVARDCLSNMVARMQANENAGMCGSRILFYKQPDTVQVLGGARFLRWRGVSRNIGSGQLAASVVNAADIEGRLDHLCGASMLVSSAFIQEVGLMEERYFLYYEEADWAWRSRDKFKLVYADNARVYHKEGAAIGSSHDRRSRSPVSAYYLVRSRILFTRKTRPWALPSVYLYSFLVSMRALLEGSIPQARAMIAALLGVSPERALSFAKLRSAQ